MAERVDTTLTAEGLQSYLSFVRRLSNRYPTLHYLNSFVKEQRSSSPRHHSVGCSVLEFHKHGVNHIEFGSCSDRTQVEYTKLATYLSSQPLTPVRRLYMLEDLSEAHIELLGAHLGVDAQVFASQIHDTHWSGGNMSGHPPKLPSMNNPEKDFILRYYEPRIFEYPKGEKPTSVRTVGNVSRNITFLKGALKAGRNGTSNSQVGSIRRNASFWCKRENDGSWNGLMLLDAPILSNHLKFHFAGESIIKDINTNCLYQGGYRDFAPWPDESSFPLSDTVVRGPLRVSLAQDIAYYWRHIASEQQLTSAINNPYESTIFLRHIIASTWNSTVELQYAVLSQLETKLFAMQQMIDPDLTDSKKEEYLNDFTIVLNDVNKIRRRTNWYVHEMKINLEILGINSENLFCQRAIRREDQDFISIHNKLQNHQSWAEKLLDIISTHLTLMETEKSISDSKSLSRLTILGFFFVPVSFACSFFSMNGDFAVGEDKFWVYFAVTVPLTFTILAVAFGQWWYKRFPKINLAKHNNGVKNSGYPDEEKRGFSSKI